MGHDHGHDHHHHGSIKNLKIAFFVNLGFTIFELIGGFFVNSIAIISDAVHDLGDSLSLGSAWYFQLKSKKKPDNKFSFGYARFSLLGALINSVVLIAGSIYVVYAAVGRLLKPEASDANGMMIFAIIGIVVNGYAAWKLSKGKSLNEKVVSWHMIEDVLGWVAILIVSIILQFTEAHYLDPILSLLITIFILWNVIKRLRQTMLIFLQHIPAEIDPRAVENDLLNIDKVHSLHHFHIWSLDGEEHVFTTHVKLQHIHSFDEYLMIKTRLKEKLKNYHFKHVTLELELDKETCSFE